MAMREAVAGRSNGVPGDAVRSFLRQQGALLALIVVFLFGVWRYGENFTSSFNLWKLLQNNTFFALRALGMTFVIITGGIDLSVGAVVALTAVAGARLSGEGLWVATLGAVGLGIGIGLISGTLIARFRVQPFVITLAALLAARGEALNLSHNASVSIDFKSNFRDLWTTKVGDVPLPVLITVGLYVVGGITLNFTRFGRHALAIGGNEEAARLAGLPVSRTLISVYALSGGLAGLAGAFQASSGTGSPIAGIGWELTAIAAVVVGGTLLTGGRGSVGTTLVGVVLLGLIFNELNFEQGKGTFVLPQYWEEIIRGAFLLVVVLVQARLSRQRTAVQS
jgi:ribose/xylose/arabinose/galactoside ABC-type transport system permease subunit